MGLNELLTPDGLGAASVASLASLTGVHRNRIAEWRKAGAPADLDLGAWAEWHQTQRHTRFADHLRQALNPSAEPAAPAAESTPAAAAGQQPAPADQVDAGGLTYAERKERAQALRAEMELATMRREYVGAADAKASVRRLASLVLEALAPGLWGDLLPALDGASPDLRKRIRTAHDAGFLRLRDRIAHAARSASHQLSHGT